MVKRTLGLIILGIWGISACTLPVEESPIPNIPDAPAAEVDPATLLPPLSPAALQQRNAELGQLIDSELALAGLGKISNLGKPVSLELEQYRQEWAVVNPAIAPFLGTWVRDWNLMPHDFTTVLPSTVPGQVCLVRYRQMETETVPFETFTTPPEFSVGRVVDGQLVSRDVQTAESLIRLSPASAYVPYDVEFLGTVEADGELRLLAAEQPPVLNPEWDTALIEQIEAYGCLAATLSAPEQPE
ncbi:hypothetical protein IQ273_24850 [Nodosilinea sp. LEGE 07298]|uniref:hypothetical protein n=1 Tax=Nodosilinea sp. LEGE 07298 TaxID=2777970 RepID=UPI00187E6147|nr:hypothetical protein [Nodosilinea sp. LEGE 07298]MBE9112625.1 hypothetical protein [Nodosilinea sp. LEGE 07298]